MRKQELKYDGPYVIKRLIKDSVAELDSLPQGSPTTVNVAFLKRYLRDSETEALRAKHPPTRPVERGGQRGWEVEEVRDQRGRGKGKQYLIKWKGYLTPTWTAAWNTQGRRELVQQFLDRRRRNGAGSRSPTGSTP